jgi:hypothetical protein
MDRAAFLLALAFVLAAPAAHAEVFRCTSGSGSVTYQEIPCGGGERLQIVDLPASYPAPNTAERDRLFQREAALDQRLEARRERDAREAVARMSQPIVQAAPQEPQYAWFFPPALRLRHHPRAGPRIAPFVR